MGRVAVGSSAVVEGFGRGTGLILRSMELPRKTTPKRLSAVSAFGKRTNREFRVVFVVEVDFVVRVCVS